ncbi:hypothetical protein G4B84_002314 [Aspergillus flavus NRRL3357]|nr:uncharacterized protein G4B84_002314 [Aspergillus flavus NRRL3357]QMW27025.1 hypothetical protein G4B84_002314 [Aspergillus flavus NRRL3357]
MDSRASNLSNLSSERYGYDFVVATTQASINSDLRVFLSEEDQPVSYTCFCTDGEGEPTKMIGLEELLKLTDCVNPFEIPKGTPYKDPRVQKLFGVCFAVEIKMQIGRPPGIAPMDLLPIISLGESASNVKFTMWCSDVTVVELKPPGGWVSDGKWNVWSQPYGDPWYVHTKVNLTMAYLNEQLDTPYLNQHPRIKKRLKEALGNLSGTAFSLQQLLIDLDSAFLETAPTFKGIDDSDALAVLQKYFVKIYSDHAKDGLPLVAVTAVAQSADKSSLKLTAFEREVNPPIGSSGGRIEHPTSFQQSATTLNYLCAVNNHTLPGTASFDWNWVLPKDIDNMSGIIAVNRDTFAEHLRDELVALAAPYCIKPRCIITDQPKNWDNPVKFNEMRYLFHIRNPDTRGGDTMVLLGRCLSNPVEGQTSGSKLLAGHFRTHVSELRILGDSPPFDATDNVIDDLLTVLSNEGEVLGTTYTQLKELAKDFSSMNVDDVLKRLAGILGDVVLSSARVVVDALLDVLHDMASAAVTLLDTKIHIPVITDILNAIGVPDLFFLDLFTWIAAVAYTVVYKIGKSEGPFPDSNEVQTIISATSWDQLAGMFSGPSMSISPYMQKCIFVAGHSISGFLCLTGDFVNAFEAEAETGDNPFSTPSAIMGFIAAGSQGASDLLVPKDAIENKAVSTISTITTCAVIAAKVVFSSPAQKRFGAPEGSKFKPLAVADGRATGAIVNSILVIPALVVCGWHFYELSTKPAGATRSAAIVGEVSNLASYISRIAYAVAVNDEDPSSKQVPIGIMAVSNLACAGLQAAEAVID